MIRRLLSRSASQSASMWFAALQPPAPTTAVVTLALLSLPHSMLLQLLFSNAEDTIEAKYIRHPAVAWFLPAGAEPPRMRCGTGPTR